MAAYNIENEEDITDLKEMGSEDVAKNEWRITVIRICF
jgi:hypothetical protein